MQSFIKKNFNIIINLFIFFQPFLDLATSILLNYFSFNLTIGIIIRMLFLSFLLYCNIFVYKRKGIIYYYLLNFLYFLMFILGIICFKNGSNLFGEMQGLLRTFYFPIIFISLYNLRKELNINIRSIFGATLIYLLLILIPNLLNIGLDSYDIAKTGKLGFFNSANEISAILSLSIPIYIYVINNERKMLNKIVLCLLYLCVILSIGTKTPVLSLLIVLILYSIIYIINQIKEKNIKKISIMLVSIFVVILSLILIIPKTNFYKNIKIHLDFLHVDNVIEIFSNSQFIDHFIFSQRLSFLDNKRMIYDSSSLYERIFGIGNYKNSVEIKAVEMDYFDIYFSNGVVGFIIYFFPVLLLLIDFAKSKKDKNSLCECKIICILLIIILSFFTGHIITAPSVAIFVSSLLLLNNKKSEKVK